MWVLPHPARTCPGTCRSREWAAIRTSISKAWAAGHSPTRLDRHNSNPTPTLWAATHRYELFFKFFFWKTVHLTDASRSIEIRIGEGLPGHFLSESEPSSTRPRLCTNQYASIQDSSARICTSRTQTIGLSVVCRIVILIEAIADRQCSPRGRDGRPQPAAMDE